MSRLDELIQELCPNGVEYKTTADVKIDSFWLMPATPNYVISGVPYITSKNVKNNWIDFDDVKYITEKDYINISTNRSVKKNDLLITMIGTIGEAAFVGDFTEFYGQNLYLVRLNENIIDRKYYYYFLTSPRVKDSLVSKKNASSQGYIKAGSIENLKLPVPPLEVQREIVRILDSFTLLTAELTAELTARKKQYEFYRDKLLTNENTTVLKPLGDICTLVRGPFGGSLKKECFVSDGYAVYEQQHAIYDDFSNFRYFIDDIKYAELKRFSVNPGDMIMSCSGTMGKIAIVPDDAPKGVINQALLKITVGPEVDRKYLKYCFENTISKQMNDNARGGAIKNVASVAELKQTMIAVPPIDTQKKLVQVLDNFDAICSDLNIGLPAEIEARQKQYEYYRDALLTYAATGKIIDQTDRQTDRQTSIMR